MNDTPPTDGAPTPDAPPRPGVRRALSLTRRALRETVRAEVAAGRRGVALLVAMITAAILLIMSTTFTYNQRTNIWMSGNITAQTRSYWAARGALKIAILAVNAKKNFPEMKSVLSLLGRGGAGAARIQIWSQACEFTKIFCTGRASFFGMDIMDLTKEEAVGLKRGSCSCEITAEDGRINLNAAAADNAAATAAALTGNPGSPPPRPTPGRGNRLASQASERNNLGLRLYGVLRPMIDQGLFDSEQEVIDLILNIMDWTDADDSKTDVGPDGRFVDGAGAEGTDYGRYGYEAKNAKMDTVPEVQLVEGMSTEVYCKLRDDFTVFSTDKINVNEADILVLRGILCEAIRDEALRLQYCYAPVTPGLAAIDEMLISLETCRQLKKAIYSTPFTHISKFFSFVQSFPRVMQIPLPVRFDNNVLGQQLGVDTKMVRITAKGTYCWSKDCSGICAGGGGGEDGEEQPSTSAGQKCQTDEDCGGGYCAKRMSEQKLTAVIDTDTGSLVHFSMK